MKVSRSYEKVNYSIRPSKEIERKLIMEVLHKLSVIGYDIPEYVYLGLGSVHYFDFVLFHKYLYIRQMVCYEHGPIVNRMTFNKPYEFITLRMGAVSDFIPHISPKRRYFVWLDYDMPLDLEMLQDINGFARKLPLGSILMITIDADVDITPSLERNKTYAQLEDDWYLTSRAEFGRYVPGGLKREDLALNNLPKLYAKVIRNLLDEAVPSRGDAEFAQLINLQYADTAQMFTLGGIIGELGTRDKLTRNKIYDMDFLQSGENPIEISVPQLTIREKLWLDQHLDVKSMSQKLCKEIGTEGVKNYRKYYRQYPVFHEQIA